MSGRIARDDFHLFVLRLQEIGEGTAADRYAGASDRNRSSFSIAIPGDGGADKFSDNRSDSGYECDVHRFCCGYIDAHPYSGNKISYKSANGGPDAAAYPDAGSYPHESAGACAVRFGYYGQKRSRQYLL